MAKVLFVHIGKETAEVAMPHLGLASLAAVLGQAGHEVMILDEVLYPVGQVPALAEVIADYRPDFIGFSAYTATLDRLALRLQEARAASAAPIVVGGPHATLFADEVALHPEVDYIVQGEAEAVIVELVAGATRQATPQVVPGAPAEVTALPWPNFQACRDAERIEIYPLVSSRGCPYRCSFCGVHRLGTHRWRARTPEDCAAELRERLPLFPRVHTLRITDDCPSARPEHLKQLLRLVLEAGITLPVGIDNLRADLLDAELIELLKATGSEMLCFGVESGNPEVFALVNKGETHDDIRHAAALCREAGLKVACCFVIGLPGDNPQRHEDSIRFARELNATQIFWNVAHPFPGTDMYRWFQEHGAEIDPPRAYSSYDTHSLICAAPTVSTPDFTRAQRRRAYFQAVVETDQYVMTARVPWQLLSGGLRYGLLGPAARSFGRRLGRIARRVLRRGP